jgi:capping protein alpha
MLIRGTDIRNIISDDSALETGITSALKEYNVEQFVTVSVPGFDHQVSSAAIPTIVMFIHRIHRF